MARALGGLIFALSLMACGGSSERIVEEKVAERVAAFRKKKLQECRDNLLRLAEVRVDSLLMTEAVNAVNDSLARLRPAKPYKPTPIAPIDTVKVKPLFDQ